MKIKPIDKSKLEEKLRCTMDIEAAISVCYSCIAGLIKNGRIRAQFKLFSNEANEDNKLLRRRLKTLEAHELNVESACKVYRLNPESFSLFGALRLCLEVTNAAMKFYKELLKITDDSEDKKLFAKLLKKEKKFSHREENSCIDNYCIPELMSRFLK